MDCTDYDVYEPSQDEIDIVDRNSNKLHIEFVEIGIDTFGIVKTVSIKIFKYKLIFALPVKRQEQHLEFFEKNAFFINDDTRIEGIWMKLSSYWNYLNFSLLEHAINMFCSETLMARMKEYKKKLEVFRCKTRLCAFAQLYKNRQQKCLLHGNELKEFVIKHDKKWTECTLQDLENWKENLTQKLVLPSFAVDTMSLTFDSVEYLGAPDKDTVTHSDTESGISGRSDVCEIPETTDSINRDSKDDSIQDDADSEEFIQGVQEAISSNSKIDRKLAHSIFVGPPGSGKSTLMDRLLNRLKKDLSLSTGVCNPIVMVDIDVDNPSTFHSATVIDPNTWEEVEYDISLVRQMYVQSSARDTSHTDLMKPPKETTSLPSPYIASSDPEIPPTEQEHSITHEVKMTKTKRETREMIHSVMKRCGGYKKFKKFLTKSYSLYLRDTGGQVEFQEMISLLIFGPSIFFFVFRTDLDFGSKFRIEYRTGENESINRYNSSITTEEALLQCLASVYAMDTPSKAGVKTHKPLVFIVGTHKDKLGPSADEEIAKLNDQIDSLIRNSGFQDLVQYADTAKDQVMFTIDNTSESDEDIKIIRSSVHNLVNGRDEFTIEFPISYLLFCLELQNLKASILTLEECEDIAANYGIGKQQMSHLLQFLHLRIGVIQYFDVDGLRNIVVKEPQVIFNKVTDLVIRTFSCKALTTREVQHFRKGILTASVFANVVNSDDKISCKAFLKLLVHLRIIAPYPSPGDEEDRYFLPCVLNHVDESTEEEMNTSILPLAVRFKCDHCPKGLFSVLVTHLMTQYCHESEESFSSSGEEDDSQPTFTLIQEKIFKDQVSFEVHCSSEQDVLSLKVFPSHIQIKFFPALCEDPDSTRSVSISEVCNNVRHIIDKSLLKSLENLHYNKHNVKPMMCFKCDHCNELHPVKKGKPHKINCSKTNRNTRIPLQGRCWFNEDSSTQALNSNVSPRPATTFSAVPATASVPFSAAVDTDIALPKEYSLLKRQRGATILAVVSDMKWLAEKLNDDNVAILNDEQYADVTEVKNTLNEKERAEILVKALLNRVEQDGEELNTFVDILKKKPRKFKALIEKLDTCD